MKKTLLFLITACVCVGSTLWANPVSKEKALTVATHFIKAQGGANIMLTDITATTPYTTFYIFAGSDSKGFVIVSADDCVPPILGYSTTNTFVTDNMPAHVKGWLDDYEQQIMHYQNHNPQVISTHPTARPYDSLWDRLLEDNYTEPPLHTSVAPLLSTSWDQSPYYNDLCPYSSYYGERTVTGCVATATAQVMKYWAHPTTGYGSHSYYHSTYGTQSANFGTATYAWSSMPAQLTSSSTATQKTAVATLMYHVGVAIDMDYDVSSNGGSGAQTMANGSPTAASAENALRNYFKYKSSLRQVSIDDYSPTEWSTLLMNELNNNRPILYTGRDNSGGHCFVCDGYSNSGQFHINWGWGGYCDGYYTIGYLNPSAGGTGGNSTYTFNIKNRALIGIEPNNNFGTTTTVTATSNNTSYGTVTGGGTFTGINTSTVILTATATSGCRFVGWNDNAQFNPRSFYANGGTYSFVANFEPLTGDTLGYCQNHCYKTFGASYGTTYWGIKLPASVLTPGHDLTKVMIYIASAGSYTLTVYTGTTSPTTTALTQSFTAPASLENRWGVLTLSSPVSIDGTQSLWITLSSTASYPAAASYSCGNEDSRLWGSSLMPSTNNYSFMIRGIFENNNPTPPATGDTLSYCGNNAYTFSCGAGGSLTWGVKFMPTQLTGHDTLTDVRLFLNEGGTYNLTIYQGNTTSTSTQVATQTYTFGSSADSSWQNCHLTTPVAINQTQPLWVVFSNNGVDYPAALCNYTGDTNSSLVYLSGAWISIYRAAEGSFNGSWMIQAITSSGGSSPSVLGDTVDYCGDSAHVTNIGAGGTLTWGIRLPPAMHQHRQYLTDVMLYVPITTTYQLSIYQGATTSSSTQVATQTATYTVSEQGMWHTIHLSTPVTLDHTQPLWIVFNNNTTTYPAALCNATADSNGSLIYFSGEWMPLYTASSGSIDGTWMIRAILSNNNTPSIVVNGPTVITESLPATYTVVGPPSATYTWTLDGATPATATGTSVTATWNTPGTYNVIAATTWSGTLLRDTLVVTVQAAIPPSNGDTLSYSSNSPYAFPCGTGGSFIWGVRFMPTLLAGHDTLTDVRLFLILGGTYNLTIYQGNTTSTSTQVATQTYTFGSSAVSSWQNCHLTTPVPINQTQPLWVVFSNTSINYPAAACNYTGDSNSSLVYYSDAWMSLYTAVEGAFNGSWMIQAITSSSGSTPSVLGDTVDYCGNNPYDNCIGAGNQITWGIRLPPAMHQHRQYLTDVMLYVPTTATYQLSIYQGTTTSSSTQVATQTVTYNTSDQGMWHTIHLSAPVALDHTQPLWIVFYNNTTPYPAAKCNVITDSNGSLVYYSGEWMSLHTASDLDGTWMIRAILSNNSAPSIAINGPTVIGTGVPVTYTVSGPSIATYTWTLAGATPATATGTSATATWNTPGTYNVIAATTWSGTVLRDTLIVAVMECAINTFPYTMGFEPTDNIECWNFIDNDGDGYGWDLDVWRGSNGVINGTGVAGSASFYNGVGVLTPDNWMVTPPIQLAPGHIYSLVWYDAAIDPRYYAEHYSVYVSSTGNSVSDFPNVPVFETTLTTRYATQRSVDLSSYAGQTVYIAFRHHGTTDVYWLLIDDITINERIPSYELTVLSDNPEMGSVDGGGTYPDGTTITIFALPNAGFHFVQWNDSNTNASRSVTVTADATYIAYFEANDPDTYTITVLSDNAAMGIVEGGGTYPADTTVTLTARPFAGYRFLHWQDFDTTNPRSVTVTADATYTAYFQVDRPVGIDNEATLHHVTTLPGRIVSIVGADNQSVNIYDIVGRRICGTPKATSQCQFTLPHTGVYLVKVGDHPVQRVVIIR